MSVFFNLSNELRMHLLTNKVFFHRNSFFHVNIHTYHHNYVQEC